MIKALITAGMISLLGTASSLSVESYPRGYVVFCIYNADECRDIGPSVIEYTDELRDLLLGVHTEVNSSIVYKNDAGIDKWVLSPQYGDCEDYAVTKKKILRELGIPTASMKIGLFETRGLWHAVLVVQTDKGNVVLDNRQNGLYFSDEGMILLGEIE